MIKTIILNGREIVYDFQRKAVKNINLRIKADGTVHLSASPRVPERTIEDFLNSKADFILKALDHYSYVKSHSPKPKQYVDGEKFIILGSERILKVNQGNKNAVDCSDAAITISVKNTNDTELKKRTLDQWMTSYCKEIVFAVCESIYPEFKKYCADFPEIRFRRMTSRWGSCQPKKKVLTFNTALIEASLPCIEYVVTHEFTHFLHADHSKSFYNSLAFFMPDWKERKKALQMYGRNI